MLLQRALGVLCLCCALACGGSNDNADDKQAGSGGRNGGAGVAGSQSGAGKGGDADSGLGVGDAASSDADSADADAGSDPACMTCGGCEETLTIVSAAHVPGTINYPDTPPAGGDHNDCWGSWGVHDKPLQPERWVHNLEHGGVVFLYNCPSGCAADVTKLEALVQGKPLALLTPYDDMPTRFAVVSWGRRIKSECVNEAAFQAFYEANEDHGLESVSAGPPSGCPEE